MNLKTRTQIFIAFQLGMIIGFLEVMLYQEILGLEKYIQTVREQWINIHWSIFAIIIFLISVFMIYLMTSSDRFTIKLKNGSSISFKEIR